MNEIFKNDIDAAHHVNLLFWYVENVGNYYTDV